MSEIRNEIASEVHRSVRKNFPRRSMVLKGMWDLLQVDLADFKSLSRQNKNYKYILIAIDAFSKKAFAEPLKNKTGVQVSQAMETIINKFSGVHRNIQSDEGKEFYCKSFQSLMKKYNINHYSSASVVKVCGFQCFNHTLYTHHTFKSPNKKHSLTHLFFFQSVRLLNVSSGL
jgi:Integrase core domain